MPVPGTRPGHASPLAKRAWADKLDVPQSAFLHKARGGYYRGCTSPNGDHRKTRVEEGIVKNPAISRGFDRDSKEEVIDQANKKRSSILSMQALEIRLTEALAKFAARCWQHGVAIGSKELLGTTRSCSSVFSKKSEEEEEEEAQSANGGDRAQEKADSVLNGVENDFSTMLEDNGVSVSVRHTSEVALHEAVASVGCEKSMEQLQWLPGEAAAAPQSAKEVLRRENPLESSPIDVSPWKAGGFEKCERLLLGSLPSPIEKISRDACRSCSTGEQAWPLSTYQAAVAACSRSRPPRTHTFQERALSSCRQDLPVARLQARAFCGWASVHRERTSVRAWMRQQRLKRREQGKVRRMTFEQETATRKEIYSDFQLAMREVEEGMPGQASGSSTSSKSEITVSALSSLGARMLRDQSLHPGGTQFLASTDPSWRPARAGPRRRTRCEHVVMKHIMDRLVEDRRDRKLSILIFSAWKECWIRAGKQRLLDIQKLVCSWNQYLFDNRYVENKSSTT
ncbi:unnamed protein product, partial [Amoebophrya sp. A25]|eukprot:GSA25T00022598001.1